MAQEDGGKWWGPPKNFSERKHVRKVGWLELFYDLAYVGAIAQLTHHIAAHPSWQAVGLTLLLFALVFWAWVNGSEYYDLHGNDGIRTRLFTFAQMLAITAVAMALPGALTGHPAHFAFAFALLQALITYLWWSVGFYDHSHRQFSKFYTANYSIGLTLLIASAFIGTPTAYWIWGLVLLLNLTPPVIGAYRITRIMKERGQDLSASATIVERFGLFTIIVLAESIVAVVSGIGGAHTHGLAAWVACILAIFIAFLLWSLYFDLMSEQEAKRGYAYMQWLTYLHLPLLAALAVVGACIKVLITDLGAPLPPSISWIFCTALATVLLSIVALTRIIQVDEEDAVYIRPAVRVILLVSFCLLLAPLLGSNLNALALLILASALLFVPVFIGMRSWVRFAFFQQ